eukprot:EG_transcript_13707
MANVFTAKVLPSLGVVLSGALYASSLPTVRRAMRQRTPETLDSTTLAMQFINALMWLKYGVLVGDIFVWLSNAPGVLLTGYYVAVLLFLSMPSGKADSHVVRRVAIILGVGASYLLLEVTAFAFLHLDEWVVQLAAGLSTNIWLAGMYLAPVLNVARAFRERSAAAFVVPLVIVTLLNSCMWVGYGLVACGDPFIYVPNAVGLVAASIQLGVILLFRGRTPTTKGVLLASDQPSRATDCHTPTSDHDHHVDVPLPPTTGSPGPKRASRTSFSSQLPEGARDEPLLAHQIVHASLSMLPELGGGRTGSGPEPDEEPAQRV